MIESRDVNIEKTSHICKITCFYDIQKYCFVKIGIQMLPCFVPSFNISTRKKSYSIGNY